MGDVEDKVIGGITSVDRSLDVLGFFCPVPISEARKALLQMQSDEVLEVMSDDPEVLHDMPLLLNRTGDELLSVEENAGEYRMLIKKIG
tara:strand:- start:73 stop:339 length:267 start_codon:yes stop_codon:yes gene_type:complete